ncbi:DUF817 family protein [Streptomyces kronopolitis]|uniref:DUF817 family protein n=1 Tax=Streptomyces kronopolitis TaxID=1612435 RepID=UPI0020C08CAD|nr:DUF817 family protein [Streptomyces kronopolitis]MCL6301362.1 DUF817 family protein [Streptomyces kronopolitis]
MRWPLARLLLGVTAGTFARFMVRGIRRRVPRALSITLSGFVLWAAENLATHMGAQRSRASSTAGNPSPWIG